MFGYLVGKLVNLSPSQTFLDVGGVGYELQLTLPTYEAIREKETCKSYTHLQIREDAWVLYGFATPDEKEAFQKLLGISGVGAATARILLSSISPSDLYRIISNGDSKALEQVKGIGAKTAQRIVLELRGKLPETIGSGEISTPLHNTPAQDALIALIGLGIAKSAAETALKKAEKQLAEGSAHVEDWIKAALKNL